MPETIWLGFLQWKFFDVDDDIVLEPRTVDVTDAGDGVVVTDVQLASGATVPIVSIERRQ